MPKEVPDIVCWLESIQPTPLLESRMSQAGPYHSWFCLQTKAAQQIVDHVLDSGSICISCQSRSCLELKQTEPTIRCHFSSSCSGTT